MMGWQISDLNRGDLLRDERFNKTAEFFSLHRNDSGLALVVIRDLKSGAVKRQWVKVSQLQKRFPKLVSEWRNPYVG